MSEIRPRDAFDREAQALWESLVEIPSEDDAIAVLASYLRTRHLSVELVRRLNAAAFPVKVKQNG
jgi:hypothetical protein